MTREEAIEVLGGKAMKACINTNRSFIGIELDADYYKAASERLEKAKAQVSLFDTAPQTKVEQVGF